MEEWRFLELEFPSDPAMNLAIDEAILNSVLEGRISSTLRFWRNNRSVIVGRFQRICDEVDLDLCAKEGISVVRRISGGGTVYQDLGNLNYTIVLTDEHRLIKGLGITESYKVLCSWLQRALKLMGLNPEFKPPGNILLNGKKISGSAQLRRRGGVLHHGTLLVNADLNLMKKVLKAWREDYKGGVIASISMPVTNLVNELEIEIDFNELKEVLRWSFEETFSVKLIDGKLTSSEKFIAEKLYKERYSRDSWNFSR